MKDDDTGPASKAVAPVAPPPKASDGLVFVAAFSDDTKVRMSTYGHATKLDDAVIRGIRLALAAYSARCRVPIAEIGARIESAHIEKDGEILRVVTPAELKQAEVHNE